MLKNTRKRSTPIKNLIALRVLAMKGDISFVNAGNSQMFILFFCFFFRINSSQSNNMERFEVKDLEPNHAYIIQVMLKVSKEFISYQPLKLLKSHHCFKPILNNLNQLPSYAMPSLQFKHQHIEDNNIFVP